MLVDINDTAALERRVEEDAKAFGKYIGSIEAGIAQKRDRLERDMADRLANTNIEDRPTFRTVLQRDVDQQVASTRRDAVSASEEERATRMERFAEAEAQLNVLASLNKGPQQVLARLHSGDPKKAAYLQTLTLGGPGALQTHMELASATGDRALASAVLIVNDNLKKNQRPFSSAEFAERVVGVEVKSVKAQIAMLRDKIKTARELDVAFTRGSGDPISKIERGLRHRGLAA
jgi:hypothetical protein